MHRSPADVNVEYEGCGGRRASHQIPVAMALCGFGSQQTWQQTAREQVDNYVIAPLRWARSADVGSTPALNP